MQQDKDQKYISKKAKKLFQDNNCLWWNGLHSPLINTIENLWVDIKKKVTEIKPTNNNDAWSTVEQAWNSIFLQKY